MFSKLNYKLNDREKKILLVLAIALAGAFFYSLLFRWYLPTYNQLQAEADELQAEVNRLSYSIEIIDQLEDDLRERETFLKQQMDRFDWQVLKGEPALFLSDQLVDPSLQLLSLSQEKEQQENQILKVPYNVLVKGPYNSIYNYLQHLDEQDKAFHLQFISISYPYSFDPEPNKEIWLELAGVALGAQEFQKKRTQLPYWREGRENIFAPTIAVPVFEEYENGYEEREYIPPRPDYNYEEPEAFQPIPSYNFPTEDKVRSRGG